MTAAQADWLIEDVDQSRSTVASPRRRPTICGLVGRPSAVNPDGTRRWPVADASELGAILREAVAEVEAGGVALVDVHTSFD